MLLSILIHVSEIFTLIVKYRCPIATLDCKQQAGNSHDRYAVSIVKDGTVKVTCRQIFLVCFNSLFIGRGCLIYMQSSVLDGIHIIMTSVYLRQISSSYSRNPRKLTITKILQRRIVTELYMHEPAK
jgi:hypothetical protein